VTILWDEPQFMQQEGKRQHILVATADMPEHVSRFHLYQSGGSMIPTMWTLWDEKQKVQHYLYAEGSWPGAQKVAAESIEEILLKEKNPDEAVPRPRKARSRNRRS
jgi:hypothetical protein